MDKDKKHYRAYEKPIFVKAKKMTWPKEIIEKFNEGGRFCVQCSGCHACGGGGD